MKKFLITFAMGAALSTSAFAQGPNPNEVYVNNIETGGTGCPAGTVSTDISEDGQAFTLIFDSFFAEVGPGLRPSEGRKNCQLLVNMHVPQGWQYSVADITYRGYMGLDSGVTATQSASYYFQGDRSTARASSTFTGPLNRDYTLSDKVGFSSVVWSKCGANRALNINATAQLRTRSRTASGIITVDSIDGEIKQIYKLQWRRCN